MTSFKIISGNQASFSIDTNMYTMNVVHKVLYWLSGSFIISTQKTGNDVQVTLASKEESADWHNTESMISQMLCDYALREIISEETKDIRNILYIKAFSNIDDFYEYESSDDEELQAASL